MRSRSLGFAIAAWAVLPTAGSAQGGTAAGPFPTAQEVLETMGRKQRQRNAGVTHYATLSRTPLMPGAGGTGAALMERVSAEVGLRMVGLDEINARLEAAAGLHPNQKQGIVAGIAVGLKVAADELSGHLTDDATKKVWLTSMGLGSFLAAGASPANASASEASATEAAEDFARLAGSLSLEALHRTSEGPAWRLGVQGLAHRLSQDFVLQEVRLWVDTAEHVPLRLTMVGDLRTDQGTRRVTIQKDSWDYVPLGTLREPSLVRLSLSGLLGPKEMAELREAKGKLDEFKKRLAEMPAAQRSRMESLVGPQIRKLEEMAAGGDIDVVHRVFYWLGRNPGLQGLDALAEAYKSWAATLEQATGVLAGFELTVEPGAKPPASGKP